MAGQLDDDDKECSLCEEEFFTTEDHKIHLLHRIRYFLSEILKEQKKITKKKLDEA